MPKIIESEKRLSESILWELQKAAYQKFGPSAWSNKGVPFYLTSTPMIAHHYAAVVLGFMRDLLKQNLDFSQPIYIFDLGAGSGRFSYLFLKHFMRMLNQVFPAFPFKIRYVMTDITTQNIDFWQKHPLMESFINAGILDFALFHHDQKEPIKLIRSHQVLNSGSIENPAILIGNYFFDTIPQDLFRISNGLLEEGRITLQLSSEMDDKPHEINPDWIPHLEPSYSYYPIEDPRNYYKQNPALSSFLFEYALKLSNATFSFPIGGFQSLQYFSELSPKGYLLICCDQGVASENQVKENLQPKISLHDTFSFPVNYHAMAEYFGDHGGVGLLTSMPEPIFVVMSSISKGSSDQYLETEFAFRNSLDAFEPKDYWHLVNGIIEAKLPVPIESLISYLKIGYWDPINAYFFQKALMDQIPNASEQAKKMLGQVIQKVWEEYYPVNLAERSFVLNLGKIMFLLDRLQDAILFFDRANKLPGLIQKDRN
jgi:hypothetical protein